MASGTWFLNVLRCKSVFSCMKVLVTSKSMNTSHFSLAFLKGSSNRYFIFVPQKSLEGPIFLFYLKRVSPSSSI